MSHHSSTPLNQNQLAEFHRALAETLGEYTAGRLNADDAGALPYMIGRENGKVVLRFPKPVVWIGFTGDQAMEMASALVKHARLMGITKPFSLTL